MYDINIVIVNWKNKDDISICLKSLFRDVENASLKIIVHIIDNSQNVDGIKEFLAKEYAGDEKKVVYIDPGDNIGFGKAQNMGFQKATARFYLALNPDIEFIAGENTLKKMVDFLEANPKAGMAGPKLLNDDGSLQYSCYQYPRLFDQFYRRLGLDKKNDYFKKKVDRYLMMDFDRAENKKVDWLMGSFILVKKEVAEKIGFFDDRFFMYFEDCDWCRRAWQAGFEVYYFAKTKLKHGHKRESAKSSPIISLFSNRISRIHLKSWLKYFMKWGLSAKIKN